MTAPDRMATLITCAVDVAPFGLFIKVQCVCCSPHALCGWCVLHWMDGMMVTFDACDSLVTEIIELVQQSAACKLTLSSAMSLESTIGACMGVCA